MPIYQGKTASCLTPNTVSKKPVAHLSSPNVNLWITTNQAFRFCGGLFSFFGTEVSSRAQKTHFVNFTLNRRGGYYPPGTSLRGGWGWVAERVAYALRRFLRRGQGPLGAKVASLAVRVAILPHLRRTLFAVSPTGRAHRLRPALRSNFRFAMPARRCDLSWENLCGAAGAAVRSSAPSCVSMASCETHLARFCRETPPDGGAPFAGANARGRSPLSLAVTTVSFRRKRWGNIQKLKRFHPSTANAVPLP